MGRARDRMRRRSGLGGQPSAPEMALASFSGREARTILAGRANPARRAMTHADETGRRHAGVAVSGLAVAPGRETERCR